MSAKPLNQLSGMPQIGAAFAGWTTKITLQKIVQTIVDGFNVDTPIPINFEGVIQPLSPQKIQIKPEGLRSYEWLQIHCFAGNANLTTNDRIVYGGTRYKIMATNDYTLDNYIEYHAVEDFQ